MELSLLSNLAAGLSLHPLSKGDCAEALVPQDILDKKQLTCLEESRATPE